MCSAARAIGCLGRPEKGPLPAFSEQCVFKEIVGASGASETADDIVGEVDCLFVHGAYNNDKAIHFRQRRVIATCNCLCSNIGDFANSIADFYGHHRAGPLLQLVGDSRAYPHPTPASVQSGAHGDAIVGSAVASVQSGARGDAIIGSAVASVQSRKSLLSYLTFLESLVAYCDRELQRDKPRDYCDPLPCRQTNAYLAHPRTQTSFGSTMQKLLVT